MIHIKDLSGLTGKTLEIVKISDVYCFMNDNDVYPFYNGGSKVDLPEKIIPSYLEVRTVYVLDGEKPSVYQTIEIHYLDIATQENKNIYLTDNN